jgi:hypothetical protein
LNCGSNTTPHLRAASAYVKRDTGIGGIVFKAKDAIALHAWYKRQLGIAMQSWGSASFGWLPTPLCLESRNSERSTSMRDTRGSSI